MATPRFGYDVFLSFRGEDTRYGFTGNLYKALCNRGIHTFIDDEELQSGEEITPALQKSIEESRIAIVVLSQNYASSSFCLDELATIHYCHTQGQLVLPVFYKVQPSDVRHQKGGYGEALTKHQRRFKDKEKLQKWKMALRQVADLSGYHFKDGDGYEYKFIESVVDRVCHKINPARLHVADYPVGLGPQVLEVRKLLNVECGDGFHMIGIHGMGGVGKTTLALAVHNLIADRFDGCCFLQNVREKSKKHGLEHLQSILLSNILGAKDINLTSEHQGISMIQRRKPKKVLLILDDVDRCEQLQALVGSPDWFGPGSRVIITTRDIQLLASHQVKRTYSVKTLNKDDALQLLTWKAFKTEQVDPSYMEVLNDVVTYASGLPLALEVIGSNLFEKSVEEWKSAINQYKRIPNNQILEILKVSFDALEEEEKCVFLDIACCFQGYELTEVEVMLRALYDDCMKYHIGVLVQKSLIKIYYSGTIVMHDLIGDMGRQIDRRESSKKPGKGRRLWLLKDIIQVLRDNTGTSETEIICLDLSISEKEETLEWNANAFRRMKNLKILIIRNGKFCKGPNYFPESLRILEWHGYPSNCLPSNFHSNKLVTCKLPNSPFTSFGFHGSSKKFENLTELNFDNCQLLTRMPDLSDLPNLEKLSFERCESLIALDDSIGFLNKLKILKAQRCTKLRRFPPLNLPSLEVLHFPYCYSLENFPEILGKMGNIRELYLLNLAIKELPVSFQNLTGLHELYAACDFLQLNSSALMSSLTTFYASRCKEWKWINSKDGEEVGSTLSSNLRSFDFELCDLNDDIFSAGFTQLTTVTYLNLSYTNITFLPECIKEFQHLDDLEVSYCKYLQEIRGLPPNLREFRAIDCRSLTSSSSSMLLNQQLHEAGKTKFVLPGGCIPEWLEKESRGPSISFWFRNQFPPKVFCFLIGSVRDDTHFYFIRPVVLINGKVQEYKAGYHTDVIMPELDHMQLFDLHVLPFRYKLMKMASEKEWKHVEITYEGLFDTSLIKAMGIHVFKSKRGGMKDIRYDDPYTTTKVCPCNFFIPFLPFFFRFLFALILFISLMAYPT